MKYETKAMMRRHLLIWNRHRRLLMVIVESNRVFREIDIPSSTERSTYSVVEILIWVFEENRYSADRCRNYVLANGGRQRLVPGTRFVIGQ